MDNTASILTTIKEMLGISENDTNFDVDILVFINSALMELRQIGVGPEDPFIVTNTGQKWEDFLEDKENFESVKAYIYFNVKLAFDPPSNGTLADAMDRHMKRLEWRLNVEYENEKE